MSLLEVDLISSKSEEEVAGETKSRVKASDDDDMMFDNFRHFGGFAKDTKFRLKLFKSKEHLDSFNGFLERKVMPHKGVDFEYLSNYDIPISEMFEKLDLVTLCTESETVYPEFVAPFYSNLHFSNDPNRMTFTVGDFWYVVTTDLLASLVGFKSSNFVCIETKVEEAYGLITEDKNFTQTAGMYIKYTPMPLLYRIIHKGLIGCVRPKAFSTTDVSRFEA